MDPYVQFSINGQTQKTRPHNGAGKTPSWSETFTYDVSGDEIIHMTVWDKDTMSSDFIGEAQFSASPIKKAV